MTGNTKHTPGPWTADLVPLDDDGSVFVYPAYQDDLTRADICDVHAWDGPQARDANANLIAAAPDLLAALEALRKELREHIRFDVKKHYSLMTADVAADNAIRKARGQA